MQPLISVEQLSECLPDVGLYDIRWDLTEPAKGRQTYERGHIPGAVFVDLDFDLAAPPGLDGRHPLPTPADFAATLGRLGISPGTHVVVYDDNAARMAARLWWMLRAIGHEKVQVLDGGYQAWVRHGGDIGLGSVTPEVVSYPAPEEFKAVVTHHDIPRRVLIDARAPERYRGEVEPVDPKAGHIPGAINIPTSRNVDEDGMFLTPDRLADVYRSLPQDAVMSCGSGVTACHDALAMVVAGREMPEV